MKNIKDLSEAELIQNIFLCDKEITKMLAIDIEHYPGAIMGLGDYYCEKKLLIDELLTRKGQVYDSRPKS